MLSWMFSAWIQPTTQDSSKSTEVINDPLQHAAMTRLRNLIVDGGAGSWPPQASYRDTWPLPLRAYDSVWRAMESSFPVAESSTDNAYNRKLIDSFRARMRAQLDQHLNMEDVQSALQRAESDPESCSQAAWLGFWLCMSILRHSYRWGVSPIVAEAQDEDSLDFPEQLDRPWTYLQRHLGFTSPSGCMTSLVYVDMRSDYQLEYSVTVGMSERHQTTEYWNMRLMHDIEERALSVYHHFAQTIALVDAGDLSGALSALQSANAALKPVFKHFFASLNEANFASDIWLAYLQGYQGWTLGGIDGISGGQSLAIRTCDAFLGIRPFPAPEKEALHLPTPQREWLDFLRQYDVRATVKARYGGKEGEALTAELEALVKQLRLWRMGHLRRMQPYESVRRPERKTMTAGISVVNAANENLMIEHLKRGLGERLAQTV